MDVATLVISSLAIVISLSAIILSAGALWRTVRRQRPRLEGILGDVSLVYGADESTEFLLTHLTLMNQSDVGTSIVEYGLILGPPYNNSTMPIYYSETDLGESILEAPSGSPFGPKRLALYETHLEWLANPVNIPPHESRSGWIGFPLPSVPKDIVKGVPYEFYIRSSEGESTLVDLDLNEKEWHSEQSHAPQDPNTLV